MSDQPWQRTAVDEGRFEVWLPRGWVLSRDATQPPGQAYFSCRLPSGQGAWSLFRQPLPGQSSDARLALERSLGLVVTDVDRDQIVVDGQPAERLRFRGASHRPRSTEVDDRTGERFYTAERDIEEVVVVLFWSGTHAAASAGYRVETDAPADEQRLLAQTLDRVRLLRPL